MAPTAARGSRSRASNRSSESVTDRAIPPTLGSRSLPSSALLPFTRVGPAVLTKDLLRVSRRGGDYRPQFVDREDRPLAARVLGVYQGHVGEPRAALEEALEGLERDADDFKLVRGFAALLDREAEFETRAPLPPERARRAAFEASEAVGVATEPERAEALDRAAERLGVDAGTIEASLYADREVNQHLVAFDSPWDPDELLDRYDLSLAQTALFDAREVRVRSSDPRALVSAVKRLRLMYEIRKTEAGREVVVTGPDSLFRRTRRYGTAFARLLRTLVNAAEWRLEATIDDRGTDRELVLTDADLSPPGDDPIAEPSFDSGVEADFAARFSNLGLDWTVEREPEPLATGTRVMIPDFAFDYRPAGSDPADGVNEDETPAPFRVYFEIMGFWTPDYVEKKLRQLRDVEDVELLVAVDESLGVGEEIEARDHRVVTYSGRVRVKDVVDVLREYEADLVAAAAASLPAELVPDDDVVSMEAVAARHGVSEEALDDVAFPEHERVGRTLLRPSVLDRIADEVDAGMSLADAEAVLDSYGVEDASAVLSRLGYRVEWEGLGGGALREK
jgi:predicted nuclease of restriction endonuclease-like RecB superfamily